MAIGWVEEIKDRLMLLSSHLDFFDWHSLGIEINELILSNCTHVNYENEIMTLCHEHIGRAYREDGDCSKSLKHLEKAVEFQFATYSVIHGKPPLKMSELIHEVGSTHCEDENYEKALDFHQRALDNRLEKLELSDEHPLIADSFDYFGQTYMAREDFSEALKYYRQSLEIRKKSLDPNDPRIASSYMAIGGALAEKGEFVDGLDFLQKAIDALTKSGNSNSTFAVSCYRMMGEVSKDMGDYSLMLKFYDLALDCSEKVTGAGDWFFQLCSGFGSVLDECGEKLLSNEYFQLGSYGSQLNRHRKSRFRNLNASNYFDLILEEEKNLIDWLSNKKNAHDKDSLDSIKSWRSYCEENAEEVNPLLDQHLGRVKRLTTVSADFHEEPDTEYQKHFDQLRESVKKGEITVEEARAQTNEAKLDVLSSLFKLSRSKVEEIEKKALEKMKSKKRLDELKGFFE
jgi:tetratricopeptide (TPR) repeat protein